MQVAQPTNDKGGVVVEVPLTRGSVVGLGDRNVAGAIEEALQRDASLGAGKRTPRAGMCTAAESDVLTHVVATQSALVGLFNRRSSRLAAPGWIITVVRPRFHPAQRGGDPGHPEIAHRRAF